MALKIKYLSSQCIHLNLNIRKSKWGNKYKCMDSDEEVGLYILGNYMINVKLHKNVECIKKKN